MSLTYSLPSADETPLHNHSIAFYTDQLLFYHDTLSFLLQNSKVNNYQIAMCKSIVDNPDRVALDKRFLMIIREKDDIKLVVTWFHPQLMVFSCPIDGEEMANRKLLLRGVLKMFCSVNFESLRISNENSTLSFDKLEEIVRKYDRKLTGYWSTEDYSFIGEEYISNFDPVVSPRPSWEIQVKMLSYSLTRDDLTLPSTETDFELKVLDTTDEILARHCANMIHRFCKICFPDMVPPEQVILHNMIMKPYQKGNTFYVTLKGDSRPIGIALATPIPTGCRITHVFTEEEYRGRGVASFLIQSMSLNLFERKDETGKQLFDWMFLTAESSNKTSNGVYTRSGFKEETEFVLCDIHYH